MMIENETAAYLREQDELAREVEEYRRINASLKKKIHARDKKITYPPILIKLSLRLHWSDVQVKCAQSIKS